MSNTKFYILLTLIVAFGSYTIYKLNQQPKVGVVDFQELVMGYDGMQNAMAEFEKKAKVWESEADSLQLVLNQMATDLETNEYDEKTTIEKEQNLYMMNSYVLNRQKKLSEQAQEEDSKLTVAVINQITDFVNDYAEDNGFDLIYGRNEGNYVLYKSADIDITEDILTKLNKDYQGV